MLPNPGAVKDFRDPKLVWHEPSLTWVMALAVFDHAEFWASAELYANGGALQMTETFFPAERFNRAKLFAEGAAVWLLSGRVHALGRIWN